MSIANAVKWDKVAIGELCNVKGGKRLPKGTTYADGPTEHPYLRVVDFQNGAIDQSNLKFISAQTHEKISRYVITSNDVYISIAGTIGVVGIVPEELSGSNLTENAAKLVIKNTEELDKRFLARFLSTAGQTIIDRKKVVTSQPKLALFRIEEVKIPLPPLSEQKRIADILDKADAIRRKRQQAIEEAKSYVSALFRKMFGEPKSNPMGWDIVPISNFVSKLEGGKNVKPDNDFTSATRHKILKVSAVTWGEYRPNECKPVPPSFDPPESYFVRQGDMLMSRANTRELLGAAVYVHETPNNVILPDKIWRFVWSEPVKVEPLFILTLLRQPSVQREMGRRASGTSGSMKNISKPKLLSIHVPLPPLELQQEFVKQIRLREKMENRLEAAEGESTQLFNSLVQRAFKGEL